MVLTSDQKIDKKDLIKEGITDVFLKSFTMEHEYSPVQLRTGEGPVKLIRCLNGYWIMLEFGEYLKDEKRRLVVVSEKEAKIGRARYLLNFKEQIEIQKEEIYERRIQDEITRLKLQVDVKANDDLAKMRQILVMGGKIETVGLESILINSIENASGNNDPYSINYHDHVTYTKRKELAKELATDEFLSAYEVLKNLIETKQYDILYQYYFQDGLPLLATFNHDNPTHTAALIKNLHRDKIMQTIDQIQQKDHLYMVAKFNIDKK